MCGFAFGVGVFLGKNRGFCLNFFVRFLMGSF